MAQHPPVMAKRPCDALCIGLSRDRQIQRRITPTGGYGGDEDNHDEGQLEPDRLHHSLAAVIRGRIKHVGVDNA